MKQLNIFDLHRTINDKKMRVSECYDKVLEICHKKIKTGADKQKLNCIIEVPSYVVGYPIFDYNKCIEYVYESLKKNGFLVKYYFPKYLYISWDFEEINSNKTEQTPQLQNSCPTKKMLMDNYTLQPKKGKSVGKTSLSYKSTGKLQLDLMD